jgi:hypothetical protein
VISLNALSSYLGKLDGRDKQTGLILERQTKIENGKKESQLIKQMKKVYRMC